MKRIILLFNLMLISIFLLVGKGYTGNTMPALRNAPKLTISFDSTNLENTNLIVFGFSLSNDSDKIVPCTDSLVLSETISGNGERTASGEVFIFYRKISTSQVKFSLKFGDTRAFTNNSNIMISNVSLDGTTLNFLSGTSPNTNYFGETAGIMEEKTMKLNVETTSYKSVSNSCELQVTLYARTV